ncbi:MAG: insulinase family protein [Phycisphaeraceae bacterium]|nr:insulinase family protein [Phycisphaeraceae bacterium]
MRYLIAACLLLLTAALAPAQHIKYEKYTLPNGLTVILHEDHSLPVASVNLWYRVGAKEEPPGRSGFAHLYEHLMFMGTRRVPGSDFDIVMESGGGSNNASTSLDRTNYYSSGPSSLLPTLLWLDADRLEDLGKTMDQAKLDKQRDVVRNEIRQQVENTPYGKAGEFIYRLLYPQGHPYHNAVYGTHEDLEAATVADVQDFFATYYVPRNASLVVAGDFDSAAIKPLIHDLFATIPAGQEPPQRTAPPATLAGVARTTMLDKCQQPKILMAWHAPAAYAPGSAEMDLAAEILAEGKASRLYKRLVIDDATCVDVSAFVDSNVLGSQFFVEVYAKPGADLGAVESAVDEEIARLCAGGPTPEELTERQATTEMAMLARLQSVQAKADQLNAYQYYLGEPDSFARDLQRFRDATPATVKDWAARTLTPSARAIIWVLPEESEQPPSARDTRPADLAAKPFAPPSPARFTLASGVPVMLWQRDDLPLVAMDVLFAGAPVRLPVDRAGLASLTASMLGEGAGDLDSVAFSKAIQSLGASFASGADRDDAAVSITVLRRNFPQAARLVADAILRPRMNAKDFDRVKGLQLEGLRQEDDEPTVVASRVGLRTLFGDANRYGWSSEGTPASVEPLTLADVKSAYREMYTPDLAAILIAGNISESDVRATLGPLFESFRPTGTPPSRPATSPIPMADAPRVVLVDRPGAVQTVIRFIMPGPKMGDPERVPYEVLSTLLGGSFTSRLNQNLREEHGYTYGARAGYTMGPTQGYFVATSSVKADTTGPALAEFLKEFARLRGSAAMAAEPIPEDEVEKARQTVRTNTINAFAGLRGIIAQAAERRSAGLEFDTIAADMAGLASVSAGELSAISPGAIPLEKGVLVLVGDKELIMEQIKGSGLPEPVEVTAAGDPVKPR